MNFSWLLPYYFFYNWISKIFTFGSMFEHIVVLHQCDDTQHYVATMCLYELLNLASLLITDL